MMFRHLTRFVPVVVGLLGGAPSRATADIIYSTSFSATATIQCGAFKGGTCTANGNSISIQSDAGPTLTITFLGVSNVPVVATLGSQIVDLGVIQTTLSGPGTFAFLDPQIPSTSPFQFGMTIHIQTSVPVNDLNMRWHRVSPTTVVWTDPCNDHCPYPADNNAVAPFDLIFGALQAPPLTAGGSTRVTAVVGLYTPEPATVVLTATGLLLVGGVASRKRAIRSFDHDHGSSADGP